MSEKKRRMSAAMTFIVLFGVVSLFSDMTHESANSIRGAFLSLAGASAAVIGFVSGLGELVGYGLRYVFGRLTDRTRRYWPMVLFGYALDVVAVPALALVGRHGWVLACALLIVQRLGKAIKKPAKDTVMSFAATQEGVGKSFAIQELLDQIGAVLGPVLLYLIMLFQRRDDAFSDYRTCFAFLAIPGAITLLLLWLTYKRFPHPEDFEPEPKEYIPFHVSKQFVVYILGISLFHRHALLATTSLHGCFPATALCFGNAHRCGFRLCLWLALRPSCPFVAGRLHISGRSLCCFRLFGR